MADLLSRLRKNAKQNSSRRLVGVQRELTDADRVALGKPHESESRVLTRHGIWTRDEAFYFRDKQLGDMMFNIRTMKDAILANRLPYGVFEYELTEGFYNHLLKDGTQTDPVHIHALGEEKLEVPAIAVDWCDTEGASNITVIDGNHRLIKRYLKGLPTGRFILVPFPYCRDHVLLDRLGELNAEQLRELATLPKPR